MTTVPALQRSPIVALAAVMMLDVPLVTLQTSLLTTLVAMTTMPTVTTSAQTEHLAPAPIEGSRLRLHDQLNRTDRREARQVLDRSTRSRRPISREDRTEDRRDRPNRTVGLSTGLFRPARLLPASPRIGRPAATGN